jgi:hypothetical protein
MRVQNLFVATQLLLRRAFLRRIGLPYVVNNSIGSIRLNETDRSSFAVSSLWGKFGGLYACGATFPHTVPLPNIFVTHLFSKQTLKRKDFQEIIRLTWAQEATRAISYGCIANPAVNCRSDCLEFDSRPVVTVSHVVKVHKRGSGQRHELVVMLDANGSDQVKFTCLESAFVRS